MIMDCDEEIYTDDGKKKSFQKTECNSFKKVSQKLDLPKERRKFQRKNKIFPPKKSNKTFII